MRFIMSHMCHIRRLNIYHTTWTVKYLVIFVKNWKNICRKKRIETIHIVWGLWNKSKWHWHNQPVFFHYCFSIFPSIHLSVYMLKFYSFLGFFFKFSCNRQVYAFYLFIRGKMFVTSIFSFLFFSWDSTFFYCFSVAILKSL